MKAPPPPEMRVGHGKYYIQPLGWKKENGKNVRVDVIWKLCRFPLPSGGNILYWGYPSIEKTVEYGSNP